MKTILFFTAALSGQIALAGNCPDVSGEYFIPEGGCLSESMPDGLQGPYVGILGTSRKELVGYNEKIIVEQKNCRHVRLRFVDRAKSILKPAMADLGTFEVFKKDVKAKFEIDPTTIRQSQRRGRGPHHSSYYRNRKITLLGDGDLELLHEEYSSKSRDDRSNYTDVTCFLKKVYPYNQIIIR